nr:helix-turn-helix transcriptional regulator [Streptomyces purpureus]
MRTVGELLRQWRRRRRLSQLDLAIAAEVSARHVSPIETGKTRPSADIVLRLADQLDVPLRDRNQLLLAAGFAPGTPSARLTAMRCRRPGTHSGGCYARMSRTRRWSSTVDGTS